MLPRTSFCYLTIKLPLKIPKFLLNLHIEWIRLLTFWLTLLIQTRNRQYATTKQPVSTQHFIKSKNLHVSALRNNHHQALRFGNLRRRKSYSCCYAFNSKRFPDDFLVPLYTLEMRCYTWIKTVLSVKVCFTTLRLHFAFLSPFFHQPSLEFPLRRLATAL